MVNYLSTPDRRAYQINPHLIVFPTVPLQANQGWRLGLFEMSGPIVPHYHKIQRQIAVVVKGKIYARVADEERILVAGNIVTFDPGIVHALTPENRAQFMRLDLPGLDYQDDIFFDIPENSYEWKPIEQKELPSLSAQFFPNKVDCDGNYDAYELISGETTNNTWSVSLLEINDSPKHYHKIEKEIFVVVNGTLSVELSGQKKIMNIGDHITILPNEIHHLKSLDKHPVRVLCFSFPAFNRNDMYIL